MLLRCLFSVLLLVGLVSVSAGQDEMRQRLPRVSLALPSGVASEAVQISYFMVGPFGGYGGFVKAGKNRSTYEIDAFVDAKAATELKVIAYLPGCEIATLNIPLQHATVQQQLPCKPLVSVPLHGQIFPVSITQEQPTEVEVVYLAAWSHRFFGVVDGAITTIRLGAAVPDENGQFEAKLPDFCKQTNLGDGEFQFILRHVTSGNIVAFLKPVEPNGSGHALKVAASYPRLQQFMAERQ